MKLIKFKNKKTGQMKITLEFESIEESDDARVALDGYKWKLAMWDLDQLLRSVAKHGSFERREATSEEQDMADKIRDAIRDILNEHNLNLE
jgi:hypothetical protein